jgi:alpha-ribazole phosphatase
MSVKTVYLLRHGDTGLQGCYIGRTDVPLSSGGSLQIGRTARLLQQEKIGRILCSPMLRCRQTMELLDLPCPCEYHEMLKEVDFGRWEGQRFAEIAQSDAGLIDSWINDPAHFRFPEGESTLDFRQRVTAAYEMLSAAAEERLLLVTHGGVIRHLLCLMLGLPLEKYLAFDVRPGAFSSLQVYSEGCVLTGFNLKG